MTSFLDVIAMSLSPVFPEPGPYVRFGDAVYRQVIGIPTGTNCAPLVADLFLYCYERDFMLSLKSDTQPDSIEEFYNTSRYLVDIFSIDNPFSDT